MVYPNRYAHETRQRITLSPNFNKTRIILRFSYNRKAGHWIVLVAYSNSVHTGIQCIQQSC